MNKIVLLFAAFILLISCDENEDVEKILEDSDQKKEQTQITDREEMIKKTLPYEPGDEVYYKVNIYEILLQKIEEDRRNPKIRKILEKARIAEENGEDAYSVFIKEYKRMQKI